MPGERRRGWGKDVPIVKISNGSARIVLNDIGDFTGGGQY